MDSISHLLVVGTPYEIFLIGIAAPKANNGDLQFYDTRMSVPVTGIDVCCIEATASGRIFFSGKADSNVYELSYQTEEGWFSKRCSKINHTGSSVDLFIPAALRSTHTNGKCRKFINLPDIIERFVQLAIDDTRSLLYSLSSKSTIRVYAISNPSTLTLSFTYSYGSAFSHAQMVNASSPLLDPRSSSIVSIIPIESTESNQIYLVAVNSKGCRLYMRSSGAFNWSNPGNAGGISNLQVMHVRFPPGLSKNIAQTQSSSVTPYGQQQQEQAQQQQVSSSSQVLENTLSARLFSPGLFFDIKRRTNDEPGDLLFAAAPEASRIALQAITGNMRPVLSETCSWINIEGFVQDICRVPGSFPDQSAGNELVTQFVTPPSTFAVLTNTGVHLVRRRRPVEVLAAALRHSPSTMNGTDGEMRKFFESIGRAEGCATCLGVICVNADGTDIDTESASVLNPNYGGKLSPTEVFDSARKYFIESGGKAFVDENQNRAFTQAGPAVPTIEMVRLSGRHDGIALYVARLVQSFWKSPIFRIISGAPIRQIDYIPNISLSYIQHIQNRMIVLQQFLDENRNFIDGLSGPERLMSALNRTEEIVLQAEHRGMHALVTLISQIVEGLSFILVLGDSPDTKLTDIVLALPQGLQQDCLKVTFEELLISPRGREVAKELITSIVNRRIAQGGTVESVSETLQDRCGSFCSADDVILYKAIELLKRAKENRNLGERDSLLRNCLELFQKTASTLSLANLKDTMDEFCNLQFYPGALALAFTVAKASDPYNVASTYLADGKPDKDSRQNIFNKRYECYRNIFAVLDVLEGTFIQQQNAAVNSDARNPLQTKRDETYQVIDESSDELFHNTFYDWYMERGLTERLLDIHTPYILSYLKRKSYESLPLADLLWQYQAKQENYGGAAQVLYELSRSEFAIGLETRIEYLSQARNFCACITPSHFDQNSTQLNQVISEELDVANIQDEIIAAIGEDERLNPQKKHELTPKLDGKLLPLTDVRSCYDLRTTNLPAVQ